MPLNLSEEDRERIQVVLTDMVSRTNDIPIIDSSCSDDDEDECFVPYSERKEWSDITPIELDEGPNPVASIDYSPPFKDAFGYLRAILAKDEKSERAFELTTTCIKLNPANYTVWYFRRVLLKELEKDLKEELTFMNDFIRVHTKNYQVWHHRKVLVEWINDPLTEKPFTAEVLEEDAKNYHPWQHRQWVVSHFNNFDGELEYTDFLIKIDIRNNSAWNHRHFVISKTTGWTDDVVSRELEFTFSKIRLTPNNESPWNYLRGILAKRGLHSSPEVLRTCRELIETGGSTVSPHLVCFLIDAIEEQLPASGDDKDQLLKEALYLCDRLANGWDTIRVKYWNFVKEELESKFSKQSTK